ncbi:unnamed protein product [Mucor hiemalis]
MSGLKRTFDMRGPSSSKRVCFDNKAKGKPSETEFEFSHEDELEGKKSRRGAVNFDVYDSEDEEVGGGVYSSDSDDENKKEDKEEEVPTASEDFDMFGGEAEPAKDKGKGKVDPNTQIEGQEFNSFDRELSEDEDDVDPQAFHDKWMEGISRKDMNKAKEALEKREREEALKEAERQSNIPQTQTDIYRVLVEYLKPGQTVQEALTSLANSIPKKVPAWKQKMLDKKNKNKKGKDAVTPVAALSEEEESARRQKVESITGLADQMMALGHFNVYEDTFEIMVRHLRREGVVDDDWLPESAKRE